MATGVRLLGNKLCKNILNGQNPAGVDSNRIRWYFMIVMNDILRYNVQVCDTRGFERLIN